jgi:hypothetical protein
MPLGGVYTGNISYMVSGTGALTEYYMWANYATTIGMGAVCRCSQNENEI